MPKKNKELPSFKIIIVGSGGVGKSALTLMYMYGDFVEEYDPTSADSYRKHVKVSNMEVQLDILDTAGQEEYASMRDNYYMSGDGFICVYSITTRQSFTYVKSFRDQILRVKDKDPEDHIPILVVGNKADLQSAREVAVEEGQQLAHELGCPFLESSARAKLNVSEAFELVLKELIKQRSDETLAKKKSKIVQFFKNIKKEQKFNEHNVDRVLFCVAFGRLRVQELM